MSMTFGDPFDVLFGLQRALEARRASDWLRDATTSMGPYPPINVFQQGDDVVAIIELPGVSKSDLEIQPKRTQSASLARNPLATTRVSAFTVVSECRVSWIGR